MRLVLVVAFVSVATSAAAQSPPQQIPRPSNESSDYQQIRTNDALETIASQLSAIREQTARIEKARTDREANPFWPPIWSNWFLIVLTGGTVIAAVITLAKLERQTTAAESSATAAMTNADAAKLSAIAAIRSVENMDRPWLGVRLEVLQQPRLTVGKPMAIHFHLIVTNVGRSAAQHVMLGVDIIANENDIDPMREVMRVVNTIPTGRGQVILPTGELVREFIFETKPLSHVSVTPTIFGGVRYTHGRASDGSGLPHPVAHTTTFGFRVKAKNNIGSTVTNEDGSVTMFWDAEVETSARDFHHAD